MSIMAPKLDPHNIMLLMNEIQPCYPDDQIVLLCEQKRFSHVPLEVLLAQYKYCLLNGDARERVYKKALIDICPRSLEEMEGLYANK